MRKFAIVPAAAAVALVPSVAMAQATGPDFTALTSAVSFDSTQSAILSMGAAAIGITLALLGLRKVLGVIRGA